MARWSLPSPSVRVSVLSCFKNLTHKSLSGDVAAFFRLRPVVSWRIWLGVGAPQSLRSPCGHFSKQVLAGSCFVARVALEHRMTGAGARPACGRGQRPTGGAEPASHIPDPSMHKLDRGRRAVWRFQYRTASVPVNCPGCVGDHSGGVRGRLQVPETLISTCLPPHSRSGLGHADPRSAA